MKALKDYTPEEFGDNKDDINSLIMEQASESAEARMMAQYGQPIEYFVEPDIKEGENADEDTSTRYKEEFLSPYNTLYDAEYDRIAGEIGFDLCEEDGIRKTRLRKFVKGQAVYWNDPDGETSGEYKVLDPCEERNEGITEKDIAEFDDRMILIGNGSSEAEVYAQELDIIKTTQKPIEKQKQMNELEKIQTLKEEIKERHEKIKQSMFLLVQMLGDKVESSNGRTYKATEDTGVNCVVESFVIEDEKLMVKTDFDGDKFTLELDSFNAEELANILCQMLEENNKHLQLKIENLFKAYVDEHNEEPLYVCCCIKYLDNSSLADVTIKLSAELDIQDDLLFYYCNSLTDLKSLCGFGISEFIITDVYEFSGLLLKYSLRFYFFVQKAILATK